MSRVYYAVRYRLNHKDRWLIWHTNNSRDDLEADGVVIDQDRLVLTFRHSQNCIAHAAKQRLMPMDEHNSAFFNLDVIEKWLRRKRPAKLDCNEFLDAWNLLADVSATLGTDFDKDKAETCTLYSKLFWGSNIEAVTPEGKHYEPIWTGRESKIIRQVLRDGLLMFRSSTTET